MNNAELIKALRYCISDEYVEKGCLICPICAPRQGEMKCNSQDDAIKYAADALEAAEKRIAELEARLPKEGEWIMDENPHDGDCRCSACLIAIDAMHERNHKLLNALTGGKWWTFYRYCPKCGARMRTVTIRHGLEEGERKDGADDERTD